MSEKPKDKTEKQDQSAAARETQSSRVDLPANRSWQPLEPKVTAEEDLAGIFQLEFDDPCQAEKRPSFSERHSDQVAEKERAISPHQFLHQVDQKEALAALAATVYNTTFFLVPRVKEHYLLGELALELRMWMPELGKIYGWELDLLSIRPDYLRWTLLDFPECLTQKALTVVRKWTSERIFEAFPTMQTDQNSTDFWSPGYLVDTQSRDYPTQVLIAYVSRQRSEQKLVNQADKINTLI